MDPLDSVVQQTKAPIARNTISEKVEIFERRINGKILPFLGLHGTLIALIYIVESTPLPGLIAPEGSLLPGLASLAVALLCSLLTFVFQYLKRSEDIFGGTSIAACLAMIGLLQLDLGTLSLAAASAIYLILLFLNATARVADNEINTVWVYLPFIFLVVGEPSGPAQMVCAVALYGPAIYVKFVLQPESNKLALGFSALVFLALIIKDNTDSQGLIGAMVFLVLVLFIIYAYRMRHVAGSSYRHFVTDAIIMGLWAVLVGTLLGDASDNPLVLWGVGVALYQGLLLAALKTRAAAGAETAAERGARLAWLQIAAVAIFFIPLGEDLLHDALGSDGEYVAVLIIVMFFIPLFRLLQSPFLALATRLWIAGCLFIVVSDTQHDFEVDYLRPLLDETPADLRAKFLLEVDSALWLAVFALLVGLASTIRAGTVREPTWWRGLVRDRHMVLARRGARLVIDNANRIAFVGGFISAVVALFNWIRFAGSDRRGVSSRDVMLIGVHVYAVAMTVLFARYLLSCCDPEAESLLRANPLAFLQEDWPYVLACCAWGLVLYLHGIFRRDPLARFFAAAFITMPLATYALNNSVENSSFFAFVALSCCVSLFFLGLLRRSAG